MFPGTIIGYNENNEKPYNLTNFIKGSQWLTYEGGKFSSSQNRGIFTDQALELYPADYWRYYLMLISPERQDTDFQWDGFQNAVNNDLNNLLGNLVNRFSTFVSRHFEDTIPEGASGDREEELQARIAELVTEYDTEFSKVEFQKPLKGSKICVLGAAYKKDVDDLRESPSLFFVTLLEFQRYVKLSYMDQRLMLVFCLLSIHANYFQPYRSEFLCWHLDH